MNHLKSLIELVHIVNGNVTKVESKLRFHTNDNPQVMAIYQAMMDKKRKFKFDKDLEAHLKMSPPTFRKYADQLVECLRQLLVFFEPEKTQMNAQQKAYFECIRDCMAMEFLNGKNADHEAYALACTILKKAKFYGWPKMAMRAIIIEMGYFSFIQISPPDTKRLNADLEKFRYFSLLEDEIRIVLNRINQLSARKKAIDPEIAIITKAAIEKYGNLTEPINSFQFNVGLHLLMMYYYQGIADHEKVLESIEIGKAYLAGLGYENINRMVTFLNNEAAVCLLLGQLERGERAISTALDLMKDPGATNWFNAQMVGAYLCLHAKKYKSAFEYYKTATTHDRFSTLFPSNQDIWRLIGAHLKVVELRGRMKLGFQDENWFKNFDETVFLSNEFTFNADKQGMNVTSMLVQMLLLRYQGQKDQFFARNESLRKYAERNLNGPEFIRSQMAVDAFSQIANFTFENEHQKILEIILGLRAGLAGLPVQVFEQNHELEMMPFDHLATLFFEDLPAELA